MILLFVPILVAAAETCNPDDVKITSIEVNDTRGNIEEVTGATGDNNVVNLDLKMNVPGDTIEYKLTLNNTSNEDYYFDEDSLNIDKDNVNYEIVYDDGSDVVQAGQTKTVYLRVSYKDKIETTNLSNGVYTNQGNVTINLTNNSVNNPPTGDKIIQYVVIIIASITLMLVMIRLHKKLKYLAIIIVVVSVFSFTPTITKAICKCVLEVESNIAIDAKEAIFLPGQEVNVKMKELAGTDTSTSTIPYRIVDENINKIIKSSVEPIDSNKEEKNIVSTAYSPYPIYMWFDNGTIYWWSEDETPALNEDSRSIFSFFTNLKDISGIEQFDSSNVVDMGYFLTSTSIEDLLPLVNYNISKVENLEYAFSSDKVLKSIDGLENWDTSNVKILRGLFHRCEILESVDAIKNWDVSNVTDMSYLFQMLFSVEEVDLSNWKTDSLETINHMFSMSYKSDGTSGGIIKRIILSENFNTSKVTDMSWAFYNNDYIEDYSFLQYLDTSNVTSFYGTFAMSNNITNLSYVKDWDVSNALDFKAMFSTCENIVDSSDINDWNINKSADFESMFSRVSTHPEFTKVSGTWNNGTFTPTP
jgi:surface protein